MSEKTMKEMMHRIETNQNIAEICSVMVEDLIKGNLSFLKFTENLETLLTSSELAQRRDGSEILSTVIQKLPEDYLNATEIEFLINFFCDRLLDHHSIIPAVLKGFSSLLNMKNLSHGMAFKIFTTMNLHFVCQSQPQADRLNCYEIFVTMIRRNSTELLTIGPDFVSGFLTAIDGERDPRNLCYLFQNLPNFYRTFSPGHLLEDAFEAVSCYFPIDFRSNIKDPRGISREQLAEALLLCLTAIPEFVSFAVPLALEKLSSDLQVAKLDSLSLLIKCFEDFPSEMASYVDDITPLLLNELKPGSMNEKIREQCVTALFTLIKQLDAFEHHDIVVKILNNVYNGVQHYLNDLQSSIFPEVSKAIFQISMASEAASRFILIKILPKMLTINPNSTPEIINLLLSLRSILLSCVHFRINCATIKHLENEWIRVPALFLHYCQSESIEIKMCAISCCTSVVSLFNTEERHQFYKISCQNIKILSDADARTTCAYCLKTIAAIYPEEIHCILTSEFETNYEEDSQCYKKVFQCYCILATVPGFLIYFDKSMRNFIRGNNLENTAYVIESLKNTIISEKNNKNFLNTLHNELNITKYLMDWWHAGCNALADDVSNVFEDEQIAKNLLLIISIIMRQLDQKSQQEVAVYYFQLTLEYSKRFMNSFAYLNSNNDLNMPTVHCSLSIVTFEGIVNGSLPVVLEETFSQCLVQIIKYLVTLSIYCSRSLCCTVACKSIATIFNKLSEGPHWKSQLSYVFSYSNSIILEKSNSLAVNAVNLLAHLTKALLLKGYSEINSWCDRLLDLLNREDEIGDVAPQGFQLINESDDYFLSTSCHCTVKLFYRQRIFLYCIPKIVENFQKCNLSIRKRYAISTLYILHDVPQEIIAKHFSKITPLIIELLEVNDKASSTSIVLEKINEMMESDHSLFEEYVETFIKKLLTLARADRCMAVRIAALECLQKYTKLNLTVILPFKTKVLQELAYCLDDKKRLVRKSAVNTRTQWFIIGT